MSILLPGERLDDLYRDGLMIIQHPKKFCFGVDAVLLSDYAKVKEGETVLDLGTGTGVIPILMQSKSLGEHFTGLEIQEESADMARRSVQYNGLQERVDIVTGDIKEASRIFQAASFDVITTNPPYMNSGHGLVNPDEPMAIARHEIKCNLDDIVRECAKVLKPQGRLYMVHRPTRLIEIINKLSAYKLETKQLRFVHSYVNKEPTMVLIEAVKHGKSMVKIAPPLIVYKEKNVYTDEILKIYGHKV